MREEDDFNVNAFWVPKEKPSELCLQKTIQTTKLSHINTCKVCTGPLVANPFVECF